MARPSYGSVQIQYCLSDLYSVLVCFAFSRFSAEKTFLSCDSPVFLLTDEDPERRILMNGLLFFFLLTDDELFYTNTVLSLACI